MGLASALEYHAAGHVARGALVRVLEDWCPPFDSFFLYYPSRAAATGRQPFTLGLPRPKQTDPARRPITGRSSGRFKTS